MDLMKCSLSALCLFALTSSLLADPAYRRISNRQSSSFGYEWSESLPDGWSFYADYYSETVHYLNQFPEIVDSLEVSHRRTGYGQDGLWHPTSSYHFNPQVFDTPGGRTVIYNMAVGDNPATSSRIEVYNESNKVRTLSFMNYYTGIEIGDRYHYNYLDDGRVESIITRSSYINHSGYEKRIMQYDQFNRKSGELVFTSTDSLQWAETRRVIVYQSGQDYPAGYSLRLHNPLDRFGQPGYARSYMYQKLPGVTNAGIVDSLLIQSFENGEWIDEFRDYYTITCYPDGTVSCYVLSFEIAYLGMMDYHPGELNFSFNSAGEYTAQSYSTDDGLSPPYYQSIVYNWETGSVAYDPCHNPEIPLRIIAYPNPFRDRITISTNAKAALPLSVSIYNLRGQKVWHTQSLQPELDWDGRDNAGKLTSTGIYIINLKQNDREVNRRILKY